MGTELIVKPVSQTDEPVLRGFLGSLLRHRVRFLAVFLPFFCLTLVYVFLVPKKYESDMALVVMNSRRPEVLSADPTAATQAIVAEVTEAQVNSQMEILGSTDVLDEVADPGWRSVAPSARSRQAQLNHEDKVYRLRKHLDIEPVRRSNVIDVSYRANDPELANDTLSRVLAAYLGHVKALAEPPGAAKFFDEQANRYQKEWAQARQELAEFQQKHQIGNIQDKQAQLQLALATTLQQQRDAEADTATIDRRLTAESLEHASTPMRQRTTEMVVPASGSVDQVNTLLAQLNMKRAQLLTVYLPNDLTIKQMDSQIEQAKAELEKSKKVDTTQATTNVNPTWQMQDEAIFQDKSARHAAKVRAQVKASQAAELNQQMNTLAGEAVAFESIQHKVSELETNYRLYLQKRDTASISQAMNQQGLINIAVAQSPSFSLNPVRPRPFIDTVLGFLTSLFLACFAVFVTETNRRTVGSAAELAAVSRYPLLATVAFQPNDQSLPGFPRWGFSQSRSGRQNGSLGN
jgi:uncharacterized protein involved in exopolysaccharide biosynthesis